MPETAAVVTEDTEAPKPADKPSNGFWWGTGRRKTSVARVRIRPGAGKYLINGRKIDNYFTEDQYRAGALAPLRASNLIDKMDVYINVHGGGTTGQAGAVVVGLARALKSYDASLEGSLRQNGFLTIDDRQVERKKYGRAGARRRFQFSKR